MANKGLVFRNVAVPEDDHKLLAIIAEKEDRSMARQLAVMIREKYRAIQSEEGSMAEDMAVALEKK